MQPQTDYDTDILGEYYAAVDLGSNSFHMVVVHVVSGNVQIVGKIKQKVRLAAGLNADFELSHEAMQRGWDCLATFSERLQDIPASNIKIVATATLRLAKNAQQFITKAEQILNNVLDVISGEEEARQIYLGVAYTSANQGNSLVVDIGGASTEIIIGNDMQPIHMVSLDMGCVTFMERYFLDGELTEANFARAFDAANDLLDSVIESFLCFNWQNCLGASGTPQAITEILVKQEISDAIRLDYLYNLKQQCIDCANLDNLEIEGLEANRKAIFPSGLTILLALFERLKINTMNISGGALREGLIYGMLDNLKHNDRRTQTINSALRRYHIDSNHANNVKKLSLNLRKQLCQQSSFCHFDTESVLEAASMLHEIGLHIEYKKHHEHGAYILNFIDLPGFTRLQRAAIRDLVGAHRQPIDLSPFALYHDEVRPMLLGILRILRIAVVVCLRRHKQHIPAIELTTNDCEWLLKFPPGWLKEHPLIHAELVNETWLQHRAKWHLTCE